MWKDSQTSFGRISIINHWTLALLMIGMLIFGLVVEDMPRGPDKFEMIGLHKSVGVLVLFLGLWRIAWRIIQGFPSHVDGVLNWEKRVSKIVHIILLASILVMPLSGYVMSEAGGYEVSFFGLFSLPEIENSREIGGIAHEIHEIFGKVIMAVIIFHILGALKHHFVSKDRTLKRMLGK
ncbi:cytochrome b [Catenovulum maritimum]|uniref:Cytochrome b561 bacterial/Ni-hydrogenase domain-containing protein n=1 Tax=Catenovulum maritimum TaxID=1513271 RepID=A0A0J8GYB5_9ALTE|nr:cytochrome b [Catenovulum maritimum]KMT66229.1 hypothetical protein XM47_04320 [Catenovulum maritimum]